MKRYIDTSTTTPTMDFGCSLTSFCSIESTDSRSSCFPTKDNRKRERRVSFATEMERVQIVENFKLTLSNSEKALVWQTSDKSDFIEEALLHCFCEPKHQASRTNKTSKRRRRKSRNTGHHNQQLTIFGDMSPRSPQQRQRPTQPLIRYSPKKSPKKSEHKSEHKSPLKLLKSRLGLRRGEGKKSILPVPKLE